MRVFLDTNVIIDVLAERQPFFEASMQALQASREGGRIGLVSTLTYANVAYVLRKHVGYDAMISGVRMLHQLFETAPMTDSAVCRAINSGNPDFEDAMQYESALSSRADAIVTRDPDGFVGSEIPILSPTEFLKNLKDDAGE